MFLMEVKLNKEKIEKEGVYNIAEIEQLVEDAVEASSMYYHSENKGAKRYTTAEDEHEFAHMGVFMMRMNKKKEFVENVEIWNLIEVDEDEKVDVEDIIGFYLEKIKNGKRYY